MPTFIDPDTGLPGYTYDLLPEDPDNPDTVPVADESTPPKIEEEVEHVGVVALGDPETLPDPDKPEPPREEPEGDPDDNDQPSGNPEDGGDEDDYDDPDANPPAG
jgi:hypothetical protein